ncbi:HEPN domain-containing protein [Paraburkholderia nodosa]|uniref:HEPN domain-containing protein n=1 Tax=Paraburkholderia nodosa TaxID=392320 RepID=UPI0009DD6B31|nr:HEPN domain-containing protein [Paraburkholderia nodosa]
MSDTEDDEHYFYSWLATRPTLTEERNHPNHWFNRAADLRASAGALWYAIENDSKGRIAEKLGFSSGYSMNVACYSVYHMMCGLALEVILKAILVQRGHPFPKTHSLRTLVNEVGLSKTEGELAMFDFYEHAVLWAGRYPVPLKCTDDKLKSYWSLASDVLTSPAQLSSNSSLKIRTNSGATDWDNFTRMWSEISGMFEHGGR